MSAWTMLEIILRQSINLNRKEDKLSVVTTLLVFVITAGCICKLYECLLTSATSLIPVVPPIDTISDMVDAIKNRGYLISAKQGTSHYQELMTSKVEYMTIFANSTMNKDFVAPKTAEKCMEMLLNENFAIITDRNNAKRLLSHLNLPLETLHCGKENIFNENIAISLRKQFPCRDDIDKWLNVLVGVGLIGKWQNDDTTKFNQQTTTIKNDNVNYIGLSDLKFVFASLFGGCLTGFVSLLVEKLTFNYQSCRKHHETKPSCAFN